MDASFSSWWRFDSATVTGTGTMQVRYKPAMQLDMAATETSDGVPSPVDEIVTGTAAYLNAIRYFGTVDGKPWLKIPDSGPAPSRALMLILGSPYEYVPGSLLWPGAKRTGQGEERRCASGNR